MRKCPTCGETYADESVTFCFNDGTTLVRNNPAVFWSKDMTKIIPVIGIVLLFGVVVFSFSRCSSTPNDVRVAQPMAPSTNLNTAMEQTAVNARTPVTIATNQAATPLPGKRAVIITENANLRRSDNSASEVIQTIPVGTNVEWLVQRGPWFSVKNDGKVGWMHGNTIRLLPQTATTTSTYTPPSSSDDIMGRIRAECARQAAAGDQSPLCGDVERNGIR